MHDVIERSKVPAVDSYPHFVGSGRGGLIKLLRLLKPVVPSFCRQRDCDVGGGWLVHVH